MTRKWKKYKSSTSIDFGHYFIFPISMFAYFVWTTLLESFPGNSLKGSWVKRYFFCLSAFWINLDVLGEDLGPPIGTRKTCTVMSLCTLDCSMQIVLRWLEAAVYLVTFPFFCEKRTQKSSKYQQRQYDNKQVALKDCTDRCLAFLPFCPLSRPHLS